MFYSFIVFKFTIDVFQVYNNEMNNFAMQVIIKYSKNYKLKYIYAIMTHLYGYNIRRYIIFILSKDINIFFF